MPQQSSPRNNLNESETQLVADLAGITRLYELNQRLIRVESLDIALKEILALAIEFTETDRGNIQLFRPETNALEIVAHQGLGKPFLDHFKYNGCNSTCEAALRARIRVVVEDTDAEETLKGTKDLAVFEVDGIRAVQSTPLTTRQGNVIGMLSTHFTKPHHPTAEQLGLIDLLASIAAEFIERNRAEHALRESEERLKTVLEGISEAFYVLDRDWRFLFASRSALKMWNKKPEEVFERPFLECFPQAPGSAPYEAHRRVMLTGVAERFETVSPVLDRRIEVEIAPTRQGGLAVSFRDIEDNKRAEEVLHESEQKLKEFNRILEQQVKERTDELAGLLSRQKQLEESRQQEIFRTILDTQEIERRRIAETLHNSLGQILYAAKLSLSTVNKASMTEADKENLKNADKLLNDAITESRRLSHELMPVILEEFGLKAAVEDICRKLSGKIQFKCRFKGVVKRVDKYIEVAIYRIIQELVMNVVNHSGASNSLVAVEVNTDRLSVSVRDDGNGFNAPKARARGIGLKTIRNNVNLLKGHVSIKADKGTVIDIDIPLTNEIKFFTSQDTLSHE